LNTNRSTNASNLSPRSGVHLAQAVTSPPQGQTSRTYQSKIVSPPVTQPTSTKSIPHSDNSLKNSIQLKSQPVIDAKISTNKNNTGSAPNIQTN
jgi:hypothetical protein